MTVYDFDNTIYRGESSVDFFRFCLRKKPSLVRFLPVIFWKLLRYKRCRTSADEIIRWGEHVMQDFLRTVDDIDGLICEFWDRNEDKIKDFYKMQQQPDDLILSGSAEPLLAEICRRLGVRRYIGTRIDLRLGKVEFLCFKENKVRVFLDAYPTATVDAFYSDSLHDLPMMRLARKAYLVKGNRILRWEEPSAERAAHGA